jgi:hypothetical protein
MMRTAFGLSFLVAATLGALMACSGDTKDEATGKGASSNGGSGGAASGGGGAGGGSSGGSQSGSSATAGTGADSCIDDPSVCADEQTLEACDPLTGQVESIDCSMLPPGFIPLGCQAAADGDACVFDVEDPVCWDGSIVLAFCLDATREEQINAYVNCFNDFMEAQAIVQCLAPYYDAVANTVDCINSVECLPDDGAGGAPGEGGAGPLAGAGGEPGAGGAE